MPSPVLQVRLSPETLAAVDSARGGLSRSEWIRELVREGLVAREALVAVGGSEAELVRRARAAAAHVQPCGCLNCEYVRSWA